MTIENIPAWLAAPIILAGGVYALYKIYIEPGCHRDADDVSRET